MKNKNDLKIKLDELHSFYNKRKFVHPDPLEFLYNYKKRDDREIVGLIASSLAYGRVAQILKSVKTILDKMAPSPAEFLMNSSENNLIKTFKGFKHRFTTDEHISSMLLGAKKMIDEEGSLYGAFLAGYSTSDKNILPSLSNFIERLNSVSDQAKNSLISLPCRGSACKRHNLFLRWMVRKDDVDPGGWEKVDPAKLIIPLDTHMYRLGSGMHMTSRKQADMRTAVEITEAFKQISPEDPVKYDFALTRLGIRKEGDPGLFLDSI